MSDTALREQLRDLLGSAHAHATFEQAVEKVPAEKRGERVTGQPHTLWRLLEHIRIATWDILEFSRQGSHVSPAWPDGYWPTAAGAPGDRAGGGAPGALRARGRAPAPAPPSRPPRPSTCRGRRGGPRAGGRAPR